MDIKVKYYNYMIEDVRKIASEETLEILDFTCGTEVLTDENMLSEAIINLAIFFLKLEASNVPKREQISISAIFCGYNAFIKSAIQSLCSVWYVI